MSNIKHYCIELRALLTKLLSIQQDGVKYKDLIELRKIINSINTDENKVLTFEGINKNDLERLVIDYPNQFREFNNTFYRAISYNSNCFDSQDVNQLLDNALYEYNKSRILNKN